MGHYLTVVLCAGGLACGAVPTPAPAPVASSSPTPAVTPAPPVTAAPAPAATPPFPQLEALAPPIVDPWPHAPVVIRAAPQPTLAAPPAAPAPGAAAARRNLDREIAAAARTVGVNSPLSSHLRLAQLYERRAGLENDVAAATALRARARAVLAGDERYG
jgi:hypothetical protein